MSRIGDLVQRFSQPVPPAEVGPASFDPVGDAAAGEIVRLRLRRPILLGTAVVLILVLGLLVWAALAPIAGAVVAPGVVRVENNSKTLRHREGGIVRRILVREGQRVQAGQVLMRFDPVQSQASVDVFQAAYDSAQATIARFQAEASGANDIRFPPELLARQSDPNVAALVASQRGLFLTRTALYRSQATVLAEQARQLETQIAGLRAQAASADSQSSLVGEELQGIRELERQGYAPKSRLLALERSAAGIKGQRGSITADIARARQAIGEIRLQIAQLADRRQTEAAEGLRQAQDKLTEAAPKLRATASSLRETVVRAPVAGYVFNLTQFTEGGVAGPGEQLMQIVPSAAPLIITARVPPNEISDVRSGLPAKVTLTAYNTRTTPQVDGTVTLVSADAEQDEKTGQTFYTAQVRVEPAALAAAGPNVRLSPGMPATVSIVTGSRTVLDYILAPFIDSMRTALRER